MDDALEGGVTFDVSGWRAVVRAFLAREEGAIEGIAKNRARKTEKLEVVQAKNTRELVMLDILKIPGKYLYQMTIRKNKCIRTLKR